MNSPVALEAAAPLALLQQQLEALSGWNTMSLQVRAAVSDIRLGLLQPDLAQNFDTRNIGALWSNMPYWAFAWAGGRALASWILANPQQLAGKRVLDLGCGSGIVALAAARAGASAVWVADLDPAAISAAVNNARLNGVEVLPTTVETLPALDLLLASDLLYDPCSHNLLQQLLAEIPEALFAEPQQALDMSAAGRELGGFQVLDSGFYSTLPEIGDFDQGLPIKILHRVRSDVTGL
jgi:predicted nicotinamide N-methyase